MLSFDGFISKMLSFDGFVFEYLHVEMFCYHKCVNCNYDIVLQISFASFGNKQSRCLIKFQVSTRSCFNAPISQTCVEFALALGENAILFPGKTQ